MITPLLSICIATYNRASFIGETLDSIIPQLDDDVELLIVDGASTDNTEDVVRNYTLKDTRIQYVRLPAKGGVDHDYDKSIELAHGEFCWLFTDDDLFKPGAVAAVKAAIKKDYDLVVVNAEVRDRKLSAILEHRRIIMQDNKEYAPNSMEYLFVDALNYLSFIGAVVIRRSIWLSRERKVYFGTEFVHVGVIFQRPFLKPTLIIAEPYICIRYGNAMWKPRSFDIWMYKWPKLVWSFEYISSQSKQVIIRKEPWKRMKTLLVFRGMGVYDAQNFNDHFSALPVPRLWKMGAWLITRLPVNILTCFLSMYYRFIKQKALMLYDLKPNG